jgi:site-specific DNA-cytosine methylase
MKLNFVDRGSTAPTRRVSFKKLQKQNNAMTAISLFTGAGGAALGIRQAGFEVRVMVEWETAACNTLRVNWVDRPENWREILAAEEKSYRRLRNPVRKMYGTPHYWWQERPPVIMNVDITKTTTAQILAAAELEIGEASILEGGFPCQGFSLAGRRMIDDPRNALYSQCVRVIREALPRTFMLENVAGLVSMAKGSIIKQICEDLAACGYDVNWNILNAADYGVPQNRKRIFILGKCNDVMTYGSESVGLHMGAVVGEITHPDWYTAKYCDLFQTRLFT